jgi:hypothetical protein
LLADRKLWITLALLAGPAALLLVIRSVAPLPRHTRDLWMAYHHFAQLLLLSGLMPLVCLVHGVSLVATDVESRAIVYLFTRRLHRATVLAAKFAATTIVLAALCDASMLALHASMTLGLNVHGLEIDMPEWNTARDLAWYLAVIPAGVAGYLAIFMLIGLLSTRPMAFAATYFVVVELVLGNIPAVARTYTVVHQLRATMAGGIPRLPELFRLPRGLVETVYPAGGQRWLALLAIVGAAWVLSSVLISVREMTPTKFSRE